MSNSDLKKVGSCTGGNTVPLDPEGRPYHFGCSKDEVSNQFLICSSYEVAKHVSTLFDKEPKVFERHSNRGYSTYTGFYKGKKISVVGFGIGFAMIDFLLREVRAITKGPIQFIQLGSAPSSNVTVGECVNVSECVAYEIDFNNFSSNNACPYRFFKKPIPADPKVLKALEEGLKTAGIKYTNGRVASNPSFNAGVCAPSFKSGGCGQFNFKTEGLESIVEKELGKISSYEMDTYQLYYTSLREANKLISSGCVTIVNSDFKGKVINEDELSKKELQVAAVILDQLAKFQ